MKYCVPLQYNTKGHKNMSKVKNENYIVIQGFMVNDLKLKGNELLVYAIIYGFSQTECQAYNGSLQYLANWTNSTKQGVMKNLRSLVEKGYLTKEESTLNNIKFCSYRVTELTGVVNTVSWGGKQSLTVGSKQSLTNNTNINNSDNIEDKERKKDTSYDTIISEYGLNESVISALYDFLKMRKMIKKPMTDRALKMLINKLLNMTGDFETQVKILEASILKNWTDIYELKGETKHESIKRSNKRDGSEYSEYD